LLTFAPKVFALGSIPLTVYLATAKVIVEIAVADWLLNDVVLVYRPSAGGIGDVVIGRS